jgi:dihydropteroate synthase
MSRISYELCARDTVLKLGHETQVMGIVNCTPDSFSSDGKLGGAAVRHARWMIREGADILDIGGESTRPGALSVSTAEEIKRVIPVIEVLARQSKVPISIDTSKLEVARCALDAGVSIVNNIRAAHMSIGFLKMVRNYNAAIVLMHSRGSPATMHKYAKYKDVLKEVIEELQISVEKCLGVGIKKDRIIIDPGIGFAKSMDHNLMLINHLDRLNILRCPILLGSSRKSFIGQILQSDVANRLMGTAATVTAGVIKGAHIVRVHDVKAIRETLKVTDAILNSHS